MNAKEFVDTNVLIYAFDATAGAKREAAVELMERLWTARTGCVSMQVLQEFYVTVTKKLRMPSNSALAQVERLGTWTVHRPAIGDVLRAIELHQKQKISFWDAMIIRSAIGSGCSVVWSEDLSHGQQLDGVTIQNPF
jgi:predicted nucleic acid-binding protein